MTPSPEERFHQEYLRSLLDPEGFWAEQALQELDWFKPFTKTFVEKAIGANWFVDGELNITYNCLDRHISAGQGERVAYIFTNEKNEETKITYRQLLKLVNKTANALQKLGVSRGDRVVIYMSLSIEQIAIMLACARMGAIHSVVYAGFSAEALKMRVKDAGAKFIFATTTTQKNGKKHNLLQVVRQATSDLPDVKKTIVLQRPPERTALHPNEVDFFDFIVQESEFFDPVPVESSTPLFILYTSGTTGTPKGIVHGHGGYGLYAHITMKKSFDLQPEQVHWTAADTGWITGHSYIVYGPLSNGITSILYEGSPLYPDSQRYFSLLEKYKVQSFYTAPTVIRLLMQSNGEKNSPHDLSALKIIGSVGEPISPTTWKYYWEFVGNGHAAVIDTWWQTETGGHMLATPPYFRQKPGSAGLPFLGVEPILVDEAGNAIDQPDVVGYLAIKKPWPGALLTCWNNPNLLEKYWTSFPHQKLFFTGDIAQQDKYGYFTVLGRADDVINVAGVRISTAEVEGALTAHAAISEAAVIGIHDDIRGEVLKAFVILKPSFDMTETLQVELRKWVRDKIGYIAEPAEISSVNKLPKTRSGKIMRRILKARESGLEVGDASTLEE